MSTITKTEEKKRLKKLHALVTEIVAVRVATCHRERWNDPFDPKASWRTLFELEEKLRFGIYYLASGVEQRISRLKEGLDPL